MALRLTTCTVHSRAIGNPNGTKSGDRAGDECGPARMVCGPILIAYVGIY
jgi:hypothetical protein